MGQPIPDDVGVQGAEIPTEVRRTISGVTWRFLGDRATADQAYCMRFNVPLAPEPLVAQDGAWAYALPAVTSAR